MNAATQLTTTTFSLEETQALGELIGAQVLPGDVLLLEGPLGAGKTALTQGIGRGAGATELVNSPTFVLINEYYGRVAVYHVDLYRLDHPSEVLALDLLDATDDGVLVVEWPERGAGMLPTEHLYVRLDYAGDSSRCISLQASGARAGELLRAVATARRRVATSGG